MSWTAGDEIHGHRLVERIGAGGEGEVWRAEHLGQDVALKVYRPDADLSAARRALQAQFRMGRLGLPGFPRIEHADLDADPPYVRMEFVPGRGLEEHLDGVRPGFESRLDLAERLLESLAALHREGLVHGDLSPANLRVGAGGEVKVLDAGHGGRADEDVELSGPRPSAGMAAPLYAAPERFGEPGPGPASDVFSFGKILYRMLAGERPFAVKPVSLAAGPAGERWDGFIFRCLEERAERRFVDGAAALAEFRRIRSGRPALAETMVPAALVTLAGYLLLWVPGAMLNAVYLWRARRIRRETGRVPFGTGALWAMQALFFWAPLGLLAAAVALLLAVRVW